MGFGDIQLFACIWYGCWCIPISAVPWSGPCSLTFETELGNILRLVYCIYVNIVIINMRLCKINDIISIKGVFFVTS